LLIASSIAPFAHADPARAKAEQHAQAAEALFRQDRFEAALEEYQQAQRALPLPAFLFNIAQCHRAMGEWQAAIEGFEEFLAHTDDAALKKTAEALIADCKSVHGTKQIDLFGPDEVMQLLPPQGTPIEVAFAPPLVAPPPVPPPPAPPPAETPSIEPPPPAIAPTVSAPVERDPPIYEKWWFWTAIGGGVALIVGGAVIGATAGGDEIVELPRGSAGTLDWR
jgi:tetratricopeptide (TPR) repeat protein